MPDGEVVAGQNRRFAAGLASKLAGPLLCRRHKATPASGHHRTTTSVESRGAFTRLPSPPAEMRSCLGNTSCSRVSAPANGQQWVRHPSASPPRRFRLSSPADFLQTASRHGAPDPPVGRSGSRAACRVAGHGWPLRSVCHSLARHGDSASRGDRNVARKRNLRVLAVP